MVRVGKVFMAAAHSVDVKFCVILSSLLIIWRRRPSVGSLCISTDVGLVMLLEVLKLWCVSGFSAFAFGLIGGRKWSSGFPICRRWVAL